MTIITVSWNFNLLCEALKHVQLSLLPAEFFHGHTKCPFRPGGETGDTRVASGYKIIMIHTTIPSGKRLHNCGKSPCYQWVNPRTKWSFTTIVGTRDPTVGDELTMVRCRMSQLADLPSRVAGCTTGTRPADGGANLGIDLTFWENTETLDVCLVQQLFYLEMTYLHQTNFGWFWRLSVLSPTVFKAFAVTHRCHRMVKWCLLQWSMEDLSFQPGFVPDVTTDVHRFLVCCLRDIHSHVSKGHIHGFEKPQAENWLWQYPIKLEMASGFWVSQNDRILMVISNQLHPRFWIDYD